MDTYRPLLEFELLTERKTHSGEQHEAPSTYFISASCTISLFHLVELVLKKDKLRGKKKKKKLNRQKINNSKNDKNNKITKALTKIWKFKIKI